MVHWSQPSEANGRMEPTASETQAFDLCGVGLWGPGGSLTVEAGTEPRIHERTNMLHHVLDV